MVEVMKHRLINLRCYCLEDISKLQRMIYQQLCPVCIQHRQWCFEEGILREEIYLGLEV